MKQYLFFFSFWLYIGLTAQNIPNPYASIGKPMPRMATLSGGVYDEFLTIDSVILINGDIVLRRTGELLFELDSASLTELYHDQNESFRFLSVDPLSASYPWYTPYQFAGNKPIECVDLDGAEELDFRLKENAKSYTFGYAIPSWTGYHNDMTTKVVPIVSIPKLNKITKDDVLEFFLRPFATVTEHAILKPSDPRRPTNAENILAQGEIAAWFVPWLLPETKGANVWLRDVEGSFKPPKWLPTKVSTQQAESKLSAFQKTTLEEIETFITTEEQAQSTKTVESIRKEILAGNFSIWSEPIYVTEYQGKIYVLDGHNRLHAAILSKYKGDIPITKLTEDEATYIFKDKMKDIRAGAFEKELKTDTP